jgi:hypothetical protein
MCARDEEVTAVRTVGTPVAAGGAATGTRARAGAPTAMMDPARDAAAAAQAPGDVAGRGQTEEGARVKNAAEDDTGVTSGSAGTTR